MNEYPKRYYTRFDALLVWFLLVAAPLWAIAAVLPNPREWDTPSAFKLIGLLAILCVVCAGIVVAAFPVRLGTVGIRSYDGLGRYFNISWDEIKRVESRNYIGFPFLRLESTSGRAVLVTLWIRNPEAFRHRIKELAGSENVFAQALGGGRSRH